MGQAVSIYGLSRRGRAPLFIGIVILIVGVGLFAVSLAPTLRGAACGVLGRVGIDRVTPGCAAAARARLAIAAGQAAVVRNSHRAALAHFRAAVAAAPDSADAQLARGETAEILGEYGEARAAYGRARALGGSFEATLGEGELAARIGDVETAVRLLATATPPRRRSATFAFFGGAATMISCAADQWPDPSALWRECVPATRRAGHRFFIASRNAAAQIAFRSLVEDGQRERALAYARDHGWLALSSDWCGGESAFDFETTGALAVLAHPDRAGCAAEHGIRAADLGRVRMARFLLQHALATPLDPSIRARVEHTLRYGLPEHDVPKLAESLYRTASRLDWVYRQPTEEIGVCHKVIAADPRLSWPYHVIGRDHMLRGDHRGALPWLEKALEVGPRDLKALYNYAVTLEWLDRREEAITAYQKVLAVEPDNAKVHASLGMAFDRLGRHDQARQQMELALQLDPRQREARDYFNHQFGRDARGGPTAFTAR